MEREFKTENPAIQKKVTSLLQDITESFLANLPVLIMGTVIALALAGELFA